MVRISFDIPDDLVQQLTDKGQDLSRAALEALAIDAYRMNRITDFQLRTLLCIPFRYELDGFLKHHGVMPDYAIEDVDRDGETSARLWRKRQNVIENEPSTGSWAAARVLVAADISPSLPHPDQHIHVLPTLYGEVPVPPDRRALGVGEAEPATIIRQLT